MNAIEYDRHRDQPIFMGNDEHQVPKKVLVKKLNSLLFKSLEESPQKNALWQSWGKRVQTWLFQKADFINFLTIKG